MGRQGNTSGMTRRDFLGGSVYLSTAAFLGNSFVSVAAGERGNVKGAVVRAGYKPKSLELLPAKWLWYPSQRTLPNTFLLFRKELGLRAKPVRATGWICAESRYRLDVNGRRIQFGPAPYDPRWAEADPVDLTDVLIEGANVIGATVLYYGYGEGTWPIGKPGFIFKLEIEYADGQVETVVSDTSWQVHLARAWRPGQYKRWYLRALQEEFDSRLYPYGWLGKGFTADGNWLAPMVLSCPANKPAVCSSYNDYMFDIGGGSCEDARLLARTVPMLREYDVGAAKLAESMWIKWRRPVEEYFEVVTPGAFEVDRRACAKKAGDGWEVAFDKPGVNRGAAMTFELAEQIVGWPVFTIEASEGTVVELMVQEGHEVGGPALLNTHLNSWTRFICREGVNHFETFDFESLRWMQLHIHEAKGTVKVSDVSVRRRIFPWPNEAKVTLGEAKLQRLMDATVNTLNNSAQETCVDGMGRERQQYSGDGAHQLHAIWLAFGETRLPARFVRTFSQGMTKDGYFLDCWPAYDRLNRIASRQLDLTAWGPLLDHGVGFNFDCYNHYMYTGDLTALAEVYPRLVRFAHYLKSIQGKNGLLPVVDIGVPWVWMDNTFEKQQHKQCAFNLYASAMLGTAFAELCARFGKAKERDFAIGFGRELYDATVKRFWSDEKGMFVDNRPWLRQGGRVRLHERTLSMAVLFEQCPDGKMERSIEALAKPGGDMRMCYPGNAVWRYWALAKVGRADVIVDDLRRRWANLDSVILNNTLQEHWHVRPDSRDQWSHCPVAPLIALYMCILGIKPLQPGFGRCEIRPQLADIGKVDVAAHTVNGPICFKSEGRLGDRRITITLPPGCQGELVVKKEEDLILDKLSAAAPPGHCRFVLPADKQTSFLLKHS